MVPYKVLENFLGFPPRARTQNSEECKSGNDFERRNKYLIISQS